MKQIKIIVAIVVSLGLGLAVTAPAYAAPGTNRADCTAAGGQWYPKNVPDDQGNVRSASKDVCVAYGRVVNTTEEVQAAKEAQEKAAQDQEEAIEGCGGVPTAIIKCKEDGTGTDVKNTGVWGILILVINILTAGVGVAALGGIIYGAVLYTAAGGNPEQIKKARTAFTNVVIGVIAYAAMYALLQFLVPGGVFSS